jgi:hypothetical protein
MGVYYFSTAVGIWCCGYSLLLNCCGRMVLRMFITAQLLWAYGVMNVHYCSTDIGICYITRRRIGESNGTHMEQGDKRFWSKWQKVTRACRKLHCKDRIYSSLSWWNILVLLRWGRWGVKRGMSNGYKISVLGPQGSTPYVSCRSQCQNNIKMNCKEIWYAVDWIYHSSSVYDTIYFGK